MRLYFPKYLAFVVVALINCKKDETITFIPIPKLISPAANLSSLSKEINFQWSVPAKVDFFELQISESSTFSTLAMSISNLTVTSITKAEFKWSIKYHWRVRSVLGNRFSDWSEVRSFTAELPKTGLIAWYPFNGNVIDESGNENHGIVTGGVTNTSDRYNKPTSALLFDGTSGFIEIPTLNSLEYKPITYSSWIIVTSLFPLSPGHKFKAIIGRQFLGCQNCGMLGLFADQNIANGSLDNTFLYWMGAASTPNFPNSSITPVPDQWIHILFTQTKGGQFAFYVNGVKTHEGVLTNTQDQVTSFRIGAPSVLGGVLLWDNKIDDIRIYNRVLSTEEIIALSNE